MPVVALLCPKGRAAIEYVYSPNRITAPMLRQGSSWEEISWEQAMNMIVSHLEKIQETNEVKSLALSVGMPVLLSGTSTVALTRWFAQMFGTPNCFSVESMCYRSRMLGYITTLGKFFVADPENSACIIVWGSNPEQSSPPIGTKILEGIRKGAKLVVVDPRQTRLASKADYHLQPRPGTDGALILGMLNVIIGEGLYDKEFASKYIVGMAELAEHVKEYSPECVQEITSISAEKIKEVARLFATTKPGCIVQGTNSLDQTSSGFQSSRGVAVLQAVTGNVDVAGGFIQTPRLRVNMLETTIKLSEPPVGIEQYPIFYGVFGRDFGEGQTMVLMDSLLTGKPYPIHTMFISGSNPLLTWPNSAKVEKALSTLGFLVVMDQFMTKTARMAHLVLPAATYLERTELCDYYSLWGIPYVMMRKKILQYGQCRTDLEFWLDLAQRMGYKEYFPWSDDISLIDYILQPSGLTYQSLIDKHPSGFSYAEQQYRKYEHENFKTPTGKIEVFSQYLADLGLSPLPTYYEPLETKASAPELTEKYPLILTTGARHLFHIHSQLRDINSLSRKVPEPLAEINPLTGDKYALQDADIVFIETPRGEVEIRIKITEQIMLALLTSPMAGKMPM